MQRLEDPLIIDPAFAPQRLQPASLELTLADGILREQAFHHRDRFGILVVEKVEWRQDFAEPGGLITLKPGEFALASTIERVRIPTDLVAQVNGKSSWARQGLIVHTVAGFIDPGFKGTVTLELKNVSSGPLRLPLETPICQLVFTQLTSPAQRPYGSTGLGSHYQGQEGVTPSAH